VARLLALVLAFTPISFIVDAPAPAACFPTSGEIVGHVGEPRPGGRVHGGIDIEAPRGTTIHAAFAGEVTDIRYEEGAGGVVVELTHVGGYRTKYMHMFDPGMGWDPGVDHLPLPVAVGDFVRACDAIGFVGSSGLSRFPHLHFSYVPPQGFNIDPETVEWNLTPQTHRFRWWDADNSAIAGR
jgi:murein DD-endopeptidase MepM/ murein hydrolase activator NlpD